jgi:hypothetical protein
MSSAVNLSKMLFDNTNFRTRYSAPTPTPTPTPTPAPTLRRNVNSAFHLSRFISNAAANTGPCRACGH